MCLRGEGGGNRGRGFIFILHLMGDGLLEGGLNRGRGPNKGNTVFHIWQYINIYYIEWCFFLLCRGWGLRAVDDIPAGTFICTYTGYLLNEELANQV